jgi:hypothetical protein
MLLETIPPIRNSLQPLGLDKQKNKKKPLKTTFQQIAFRFVKSFDSETALSWVSVIE